MKTKLFALALLLMSAATFAQNKADEAAIKAVLEGHSQAVMDKDAEKAVSYFANSPNTAISFQEPGSGYIRGYQAVTDTYRSHVNADSFKKSDDKLTTADYRFRIVGNTAFVTYIETDTAPNGSAKRTHKVNYLEKENGQWKMLGNFWMPEQKTGTYNQDMIEDWERAKTYTKEYLDAMPEEGYDFRPTPDMRSFAQQYLHVVAVNYRYVNFATGQPNPYPGDSLETVKEMQSKATVTKLTLESYDAVINALKNLTDTQLQEKETYYKWTTTREIIFRKGLEHLTHHRAQTTVYLRLKGVVPPGEKLLNATERKNLVQN